MNDPQTHKPWMNAAEESALVRAAQRGESTAFLALVRGYHAAVYRFAFAMTSAPADAVALTIETFAHAWRGIERAPVGDSIYPWLTRITTNLSERQQEARSAQRRGHGLAAAPSPNPGDACASGVDAALGEAACASLLDAIEQRLVDESLADATSPGGSRGGDVWRAGGSRPPADRRPLLAAAMAVTFLVVGVVQAPSIVSFCARLGVRLGGPAKTSSTPAYVTHGSLAGARAPLPSPAIPSAPPPGQERSPGDASAPGDTTRASARSVRPDPAARERAQAPAPAAPARDTAPASPRAGMVCGEVRDAAGRGVAGAQVMFADLATVMATDRRGRFCLSVPLGDRTLSVLAVGFEPLHQGISVRRGTPELILTLASAAPVRVQP